MGIDDTHKYIVYGKKAANQGKKQTWKWDGSLCSIIFTTATRRAWAFLYFYSHIKSCLLA